MKLYVLNTGYFKLDGGAMFGVVPKTMWQKTNPADDNNMCSWALRSLLVFMTLTEYIFMSEFCESSFEVSLELCI